MKPVLSRLGGLRGDLFSRPDAAPEGFAELGEYTIFYSWQSDLPRKYTRDVIHRAAASAIDRLNLGAALEDSPRLDHDTQGESGAPPVAETIAAKIERSGIFIADLSFVARLTPSDPNKRGKRLPNPNVLIELGYAARALGWDRLILVLNTACGLPDELPFDLKHRRFPLTYAVASQTKDKLDKVEAALSGDIESAIAACGAAEHTMVLQKIERLDVHCLRWMKDLGYGDYFEAPERRTMGEIVGSQRLDDGLIRLIELELLRCDVSPGGKLYAYHWTYLGKLVLRRLGFRHDTGYSVVTT